jgi:hypothetical protein
MGGPGSGRKGHRTPRKFVTRAKYKVMTTTPGYVDMRRTSKGRRFRPTPDQPTARHLAIGNNLFRTIGKGMSKSAAARGGKKVRHVSRMKPIVLKPSMIKVKGKWVDNK